MRRPAKIATYYGRLKVAQDAPPEVIRAAYKALAQKVHPDRHQGSLRHELVLAALNKARDVLLDPARRAAHDQWIREEEIRRGWRAPEFAAAPGLAERGRRLAASVRRDGLSWVEACRLHLTPSQRAAAVGALVMAAAGVFATVRWGFSPRTDPLTRVLGSLPVATAPLTTPTTGVVPGVSTVAASATLPVPSAAATPPGAAGRAASPAELRPALFPGPAPR